MTAGIRDRIRTDESLRGPIRLALALSVANAVLIPLFGGSVAAVLGSFAVIVHLYFLDFDGDLRERAVGHLAATFVGLVAVALGTLLAAPLALAVASAVIVSSAFALARTLRGYVARSAVGLQIPFFVPLMAAPAATAVPDLLAAWCIGSAVAGITALAVLPHRHSGAVRRALASWLGASAGFARALADRAPETEARETEARDAVTGALDDLEHTLGDPAHRPGAVGRRHRALVQMVDRAMWTRPLLSGLAPLREGDDTTLLDTSGAALTVAAGIVGTGDVPPEIPDVHAARVADLELLAGRPTHTIRDHYVARVFSIVAAAQLWLAGASRGVHLPEPDFGSVADGSPLSLLRTSARWNSIWFGNALRTGAGVAVCVLLVRELSLKQGLWVIFAALMCMNHAFSPAHTARDLVTMTAGAATGVAVAGLLLFADPPFWLFALALPVVAALAKYTSSKGTFLTQVALSPLLIVDLAVVNWPTDPGLAVVRVQNVLLGAAVAAALTLVVFPYGLARRVTAREAEARTASLDYVRAAVAAARGGAHEGLPERRAACIRSIAILERTLDAANVRPSETGGALGPTQRCASLARDRLVGGDVCADLTARRRADPRMVPVAEAFADWWVDALGLGDSA